MAITASLVKELRERTGAGMMECKKALTEANGDIELAIENMRKSGQAKAAKKAGRVAAEGLVAIKTAEDNKSATIVEINSETDFVARGEDFIQFCDQVATTALTHQINDIDTLLATATADGVSVEDARKALIAKIGENINVRRVSNIETDGLAMAYSHGGRIGVIVAMQGGNEEIAKDMAMQVAASNPEYIKQSDVPTAAIDKEKEIVSAQIRESGKPEAIVEKIVTGRINKFLDEVSLLGQPFVKEPKQTVAQVLKAANAEVTHFVRFEVGEGIEKEEDNFAEEVMAQVKAK